MNQHSTLDWPLGGGELGELVRAFDWSKTSLGPKSDWPQSLKTAVDILLQSPVPIVMLWGEDGIMIYNDAYSVFAGRRHPRLFGSKVLEGWPEVAEFNANVMRVGLEGGTLAYRDQHLILYRNGQAEDVWMNLDYSPVLDETGKPAGVLAVVVETTGRVIGERRLQTLREVSLRAATAGSVDDVCRTAADAIAENRADLPSALFYVIQNDLKASLIASYGAEPRGDVQQFDLRSDDELAALFERVRTTGLAWESRSNLLLAGDRTGDESRRALVLPITSGEGVAGFLVVEMNSFLVPRIDYRDFLQLVASQVSKAVTTAKALEEERRRVEALAELDRAKTAFFSNVSHEFRTPLTLMLAPVEDLLANPEVAITPNARESLELIHRNGIRLMKLVNSLLDFARIEAGRVKALYAPIDLAELTTDVTSNFRSAAERAGLRLVVDCPPLPEPVYVDRDMWEKIVLNLLSNAIKFTFEGEIRVSLRIVDGAAELEVRDTGVGIAEEELPRLFERFHRVEGTRARTHEGSGIGLALVQELVRLHGGTIRVTSVVGKGSAFIVSIPLGAAHVPTEQVEASQERKPMSLGAAPYVEEALRWVPDPYDDWGQGVDEAAATVSASNGHARDPRNGSNAGEQGIGLHSSAPRILVADDNADMRDYVQRLLSPHYSVEAVSDGVAALAVLRERRPDIVLADVMMPNLDGFGLLQAIREDSQTSTIPVVLLSARAGEEARVEGLKAGADDYLIKPFGARELLARVDASLKLTRTRREAEEAIQKAMTEEQAARAEAEAAHQRIHDLFMQAPALISIMRGPEHVYELANPIYQKIVGNRDILGKPIREALPELEGQGIFEVLDRVYQAGEPYVGTEIPLQVDRHGDGTTSEVIFTFVYQPFRGRDGQVEGIMVYGVEVTEQVRARQEIESAIRARDEFLSVAAHELKTPVTSIKGSAQLLARVLDRGQLDEARLRRYIGTITGSASRLSALTNDLLDVSRIQTGRLALNPSEVDLCDFVREIVDHFRDGLDEQYSIRLNLPDYDCTVMADTARLEQILLNLLDNAVKYSPNGGVVDVSLESEESNYVLRVRDSGIGLPAEDRETIFEPFGRANNATRQHMPGMGLGLYICRRIAEQHGGRIWAESQGENQGTTLVVTMPYLRGSD